MNNKVKISLILCLPAIIIALGAVIYGCIWALGFVVHPIPEDYLAGVGALAGASMVATYFYNVIT